MAVIPDTVYTRRLALLAEYGVGPMDVPEYGFTHEGFEVIGIRTIEDFARRPASVTHIYQGGEKALTRATWAHGDEARAREAINGDLTETFTAGSPGFRDRGNRRDLLFGFLFVDQRRGEGGVLLTAEEAELLAESLISSGLFPEQSSPPPKGEGDEGDGRRPWTPEDGDTRCQECGRRNPVWYAAHAQWNLVMGGPDATEDPGGILCPTCYHSRWEALPVPAEEKIAEG